MPKSLLADLSLVVVAISWGITFLPVQDAINSINVFSFLFWRFLLSAILMCMVALKFDIKFDKVSVYSGIFLGFFLFCGFAFQTYGLKYTITSTVAFITGLYVVIVPFLMFIFFNIKVKIFTFMGVFLSLFGLYFLSGANDFGLGRGEILTIICAFAYAVQITFTGHFVHKCNIYGMMVVQFLAVAFLSFICALLFGEKTYDGLYIMGGFMGSWNQSFLFALILTATIATVFAFFVQTLAQRYTTAAKTALIFTLEPVSAGIIGYFIGKELLSEIQIFGAILILVGILISEIGGFILDRLKSKR